VYFQQADNSITRQHGGTGLGLALSRQLVRGMGGEIEVRSVLGEGSIFVFTLPLEEAPIIQERAEAKPRTPLQKKWSGRVLLVEDDRVNQAVARGFLTRLGLEVRVAADGAQALRILDEDDFDLVFMDCHMPVLDGYTATMKLRQIEGQNQHLPVIALTASAMEEDRRRCFASGMDDILAKPLDESELLHVLERWLPARSLSLA